MQFARNAVTSRKNQKPEDHRVNHHASKSQMKEGIPMIIDAFQQTESGQCPPCRAEMGFPDVCIIENSIKSLKAKRWVALESSLNHIRSILDTICSTSVLPVEDSPGAHRGRTWADRCRPPDRYEMLQAKETVKTIRCLKVLQSVICTCR